ncbi:Spy/CpxP family protein refolding chaperone [Desulfoscipio geothermicus]|uniref:Heavy-metal resistance n=1 Tax=Desulfoscipio geothermicus DSM 3669 TaxID=1121426 RepID=A0A1I6D282_9FIRM|nr:Spy/CpxP family protein refolding chaperone [Desulfoscipio geothermicus]SFQ99594.1 Heavy-metal resistance [Desulfoscipio geothermicus DSM 3669]
MNKKIVLLTVTLLLVFGIVQVAAAAGMGWGGNGPRMLNSDDWVSPVDAINLTDQQIAKMQEIRQKTYAQTRDLRIKLMDSMQELRQLQLQKNPDKAKIDAKIKEINDLRGKLYGIAQQSREQCRSLLTQEQLAQMAQNRGKWGRGFRGGFGAGSTQ